MIRHLTHNLLGALALPLRAGGSDRAKGAGHFLQEVPDPLAAWPRLLAGLSHGPSETTVPPPTSLPFGPTVLRLGTDGIWEGGEEATKEVVSSARRDMMCSPLSHEGGGENEGLRTKLRNLGVAERELCRHLKVNPGTVRRWCDQPETFPDGVRLAVEEARTQEELFADLDRLYQLTGPGIGLPLTESKTYWSVMHELVLRSTPITPKPVVLEDFPEFTKSRARLGINQNHLASRLGISRPAISHMGNYPPSGMILSLAKAKTAEEALASVGNLYEKRGDSLKKRDRYWHHFRQLLSLQLPKEANVPLEPAIFETPAYFSLPEKLATLVIPSTELAKRLCVAENTIHNWISGKRRIPEGVYLAIMRAKVAEDLFLLLDLLYMGGVSWRSLRRRPTFWETVSFLRQIPPYILPREETFYPEPKNLKELMAQSNLRPIEFASSLGIPPYMVTNWRRGLARPPEDLLMVLSLCRDKAEAQKWLRELSGGHLREDRMAVPDYWRALRECRFSTNRNPLWVLALSICLDLGESTLLRSDVIPPPPTSSPDPLHLSGRFVREINRLGIWQNEIATLLEVDDGTITKWKENRTRPPARLIPTLERAVNKEHAYYLVMDLLGRCAMVHHDEQV